MKYALNLLPVIPVRKEPKETSEMTTQLLFGEIFTVSQEINQKFEICNNADNYKGWVDGKMITIISEQEYISIASDNSYRTFSPIVRVKEASSEYAMSLTIGSYIPFFDKEKRSFLLAGKQFFVLDGEVYQPKERVFSPAVLAQSFLHVPYLWGGKNFFGIDCSGFVQLVMGLSGQNLPRDSKEQSNEGTLVPYENRKENDLVFFSSLENERISHVGIVLGENKIIHASGRVRIDTLTSTGIYSEELEHETHKLICIKRIID